MTRLPAPTDPWTDPDCYTGNLLDVAANLANADSWWRSRVQQAIAVLCRVGEPFTSDDVFEQFGIEQPESRAEKNHVGSAIAHAAKAGRIAEVGRIKSSRPEANGRKITLWMAAAA